MIYWDFCILEEFDLVKKNERLEKEKLKKKYIEKEITIVIIISISSNFSFSFFDPLLLLLFDIEFKALLVDINTSNRIPIVFQGNWNLPWIPIYFLNMNNLII